MDEDEFGGFEAAEVDEPAEATPGAQQASPWAFFPGQNQPDLIRPPTAPSAATDIRPNVQDPLEPNFPSSRPAPLFGEGASGGAAAPIASPAAATGGTDNWQPEFKQFNQAGDSRSLSEQVLEPHFGAVKSDRPVPDGVLDLDLTQRQQRPAPADDLDLELELEEPDIHPVHAASANHSASQQNDQLGSARQEASVNDNAAGSREMLADQGLANENESFQLHLNNVQEEKSRLQKELEELARSHTELTLELSRVTAELTEAREEYAAVDRRHADDLEQMRTSGQRALAVIVEEYKELVKTAVLEQQQTVTEHAQSVISKERASWQQLLHTQQEEFTSQLEAERSQLREEIREALAEERLKHREEIKSLVENEKVNLDAQIRESVQTVREENENLVEEKYKQEREKIKIHLDEQKRVFASELGEERAASQAQLSAAVQQEALSCKERVRVEVEEERSRAEQRLQELTDCSKLQIQRAVAEQKQREDAVLRRSLLSSDLFLESARQQLQLLLTRPGEHAGSATGGTSTGGSGGGGGNGGGGRGGGGGGGGVEGDMTAAGSGDRVAATNATANHVTKNVLSNGGEEEEDDDGS